MKAAVLLVAIVLTPMAMSMAWGTDEGTALSGTMSEARAALRSSHGGQIISLLLGERLEYQNHRGDPAFAWEAQGWVGTDTQKLWVKTEGEYEFASLRLEDAEVQALYSHAIAPFWDLQAGVRRDFAPGLERTHAVLGIQGLAPYWFEFDGALFVSDAGVISTRIEAEYALRLTQRLILQSRIEVGAAFANDFRTQTGSGLSAASIGLRLRYEVRREFAPYIGFEWERASGNRREILRETGESVGQLAFVAGVRVWY